MDLLDPNIRIVSGLGCTRLKYQEKKNCTIGWRRSVAYAEICEGGVWNRKNDCSKWSW